MIEGFKIPKVTFRIRTGDEVETDGGCAIGGEWHNATTDSYFKNKRVVIFSLPGAFTPTCSSQQLPGFEKEYNSIKDMEKWLLLNKKFSAIWPNISKKKEPMSEHEKFRELKDKYDKHFSEKPGK